MKTHGSRGFTLIELMVAVSLFAVVMVVSVGSLLSLVAANRKARALENVMNNLNIALDGMVRSMRMGNTFNCGGEEIPADPGQGRDCASGGDLFSFAPFGANPSVQSERWVYEFVPGVNGNGQIVRSREGGASGSYVAITAPEVSIQDAQFYVYGTARGSVSSPPNTVQPKVVIVLRGTAGAPGTKAETTFSIQATAVQRVLDL